MDTQLPLDTKIELACGGNRDRETQLTHCRIAPFKSIPGIVMG